MIVDWIEKAISDVKISARKLSKTESLKLSLEVICKFCNGNDNYPAWSAIREQGSLRPSGWRDAARLVGERQCFLMVETESSRIVFELENGIALEHLLEECPGFVFYVFDRSMTFLMCHNDHDYLIGCGVATGWIEGLESDGV
jgi:hypothetical protein